MVIRTVCYDQNGVLRSAERCVTVIRTVCYGDQNGVLKSAERCVMVIRTVYYSQQNGVICTSEAARCVSFTQNNYTNDCSDMIIIQHRIHYLLISIHNCSSLLISFT